MTEPSFNKGGNNSRANQMSPFKISNNTNELINSSQSNPVKSKPMLHQRSHSQNHDSYDLGSPHEYGQTNQSWTQLIPPLPSNNSFNLSNHDQYQHVGINAPAIPRSNRHSITDSPTPSPPINQNNDSINHGSFPFHQQNTFSVKNNKEIPPMVQQQLSQRPLTLTRNTNSNNKVPQTQLFPPPHISNSNSNSNSNGPSSNNSQATSTDSLSYGNNVNNMKSLNNKRSIRKKKKICKKCGLEITGQFVRALSSAFHVDCFCCNDCGVQCSSKFFPYEITDKNTNLKYQVALCEYDYFKKLDLICYNCNNALRGPYITALGNKYHLEHFKCAICQKVFESDESYYEHDNKIYCHYHYSTLYATHCEGCKSSIVKQFVELFRGGRNQQWHPECYMVHKFWNVCITADTVGLNQRFNNSIDLEKLDFSSHPDVLMTVENEIEEVVMKCWLTLSSFEEVTASCISDMLLNACIGNQFNGLMSTGKLVLFIEILFKAITYLQTLLKTSNFDVDDIQILKKEPRNISGKIMSYLAILRKSNQISSSGSLSSELLSVITGCAHYLKLLIRTGLQNSLLLNKVRGDAIALNNFLIITNEFDEIYQIQQRQPPSTSGSTDDKLVKFIQARLSISLTSSDLCEVCHKSIEKSCVKTENKRWHFKCFKCDSCGEEIDEHDIETQQLSFNDVDSIIHCKKCEIANNEIEDFLPTKFEIVDDLSQLIFLLKIAFLRSKQVMALDYKNNKLNKSVDRMKSDKEIKSTYSDTLNDITRLRTKRQSHQLSNSVKQNARRSVIIDAPEADIAQSDLAQNEDENVNQDGKTSPELSRNRNISISSSQKSYIDHQNDHDHFNLGRRKSLIIREEPQRQISNNHLNRTSDLLKNEKSLTLDDIPRMVAAEQARDQRPNAFKHHNSLYQRQKPIESIKNIPSSSSQNNNTIPANVSNSSSHFSQKSPIISKGHKYYSELDKSEHFILRHIAVEALLQLLGNKYNRTELLSLIQTRKLPTFWDKFKFGNSDKKDKVSGVFGVDLQDLTKKYGIDSDLGVGPSKLRIPILIDDLICSLKTKDMSVEGIFRLNGNIKKLRELTDQINGNPLRSPDFTAQTAVQLAALMKKWLRDLPNPLLTFNLYDLWISSQKEPDHVKKKRIIKLIYCMLPRSHRNLVEVLLYFFNWVASFAEIDEETGSKMDIHNLATVISPNILYAKPANENEQLPQSGDSYFLAIEVVNQLIETHDELSVIPDDLLEFFEKCSFKKSETISTKEIMNKIEKASKEIPNFFTSFDVKDDSLSPSNQEVKTNVVSRGHSSVSQEHHGETSNVKTNNDQNNE